MNTNQFTRSSKTIVEDVFHFSNGRELASFKEKYEEDLSNCIKVEDDEDELLYVICSYDNACNLMTDFREFYNDKTKKNPIGFLKSSIDELRDEGHANEDIMQFVMAQLNEELEGEPSVEKKEGKFFCDVKGKELKIGDLVEIVDLTDFVLGLESHQVGDALIVTFLQDEEVGCNFIHFKNLKTSESLSAFGYRVRAFIQ